MLRFFPPNQHKRRRRRKKKRKKKGRGEELTINHRRHALFPVIERVQKGAAEPDGRGAEAEALEDIGAAADAAVDEDGEAGEGKGVVLADVEEGEEGWGGGIEVAAAVVAGSAR